jgi:Fe-S-cluster containining protein
MNQKEINTIKAYIKRHNIKQQKHALFVYKDPMFDATCPFLDDTKPIHKCLIYEVRPLICREFKCDKWHQIDTDGVLFKSNLHPVDVTEVFFGKGCDTCH